MIEPLSDSGSNWRFASLSILRVAKAKRLERDLNSTPPGVALVLELLDEIADLRSRLKAFDGGAEANVKK